MADNQITPFQLTDQFTMDNFNQRIKEKEGVTENLLKTVVLTLYVLYKTLLRGELAAEQGFYRKKKGKKYIEI